MSKFFNRMMFALFLFFLSLSPFNFALRNDFFGYSHQTQIIINNGREISLIIAFIWLLINLKFFKTIMRQKLGYIPIIVLMIHFFLTLKLLFFGYFQNAALNILIILFQILVILRIVGFFIDRFGSAFLIGSITLFSTLLLMFNFYIMYTEPIAYIDSERFTGSAANPQHLALNLSLIFPVALSSAIQKNHSYLLNIYSAILTFGLAFLIIQTGSRTGAGIIILVSAIAVFNIFRQSSFLKILIIIFLIFISLFFINLDNFMDTFYNFFLERGDTRSDSWNNELERFYSHPLFGDIPNESGKYKFAESLWLSMLANGGLLVGGLIISIIFLITKLCFLTLKKINSNNLHAQLSLFILITVFFLSLFEAVFAGTYSSFAFISFVYFLLSQRLLNNFKDYNVF